MYHESVVCLDIHISISYQLDHLRKYELLNPISLCLLRPQVSESELTEVHILVLAAAQSYPYRCVALWYLLPAN
jgi:hypothetical protein